MAQYLKARPYTALQLLKLYWQSDQRVFAYSMLAVVLLMTIALVGMDVVFTTWYNYFYDALQDYKRKAAYDLIWIFLFLAAIYIVIGVYRYYIQQFLALRWRRWMTEEFLDRWLEKRSYYYLENFSETTDNPDQRIQEDIGSMVLSSLSLAIGVVSSCVTIFAFIFVLWALSGTMDVSLGPLGVWHIPGYLVWVGIVYSLLGTWVAFKIGYPLVSLNFEQQRREANFRFAAIDLRSHSENIALYRAEQNQNSILKGIFSGVLGNWYAIILRQKLLLWFTQSYNQIAVVLPLAVVFPRYFTKVIKLGGLVQALNAFGRIQDALSFFVNSYVALAEWRAMMRRLLTFLNHMYELEKSIKTHNHFVFFGNYKDQISVKHVSINTPREEKLLENINLELEHGKNYIVKGESGVGKSTFVRTLAGIWPFGAGEIGMPDNKKILFLPQRPYMPLGTLRDALLFPDRMMDIADEDLCAILMACDLPELVDSLHEVAYWSARLSPGELQRIAFVRVLLQKPDWVFLDETTSSLDLRREKMLYELVKTRLPHCSIVSVGHRPSLDAFHDTQINIETYAVGER
jgi:putative ATP-binding cassette transporter